MQQAQTPEVPTIHVPQVQPWQEAIYHFIMQTPPAVIQNWKRIFEGCHPNMGQYLSVRNGIGTIANMRVVSRFPVPGCPDGFYGIKDHDTLQKKGPAVLTRFSRLCTWLNYCDFDLVNPDFENVLSRCQPSSISHRNARIFEAKCEQFRDPGTYRSTVIINESAAYNGAIEPFIYPFGVKQGVYDATALSLAFRETLRWMGADARKGAHTDDSWMDTMGFAISREPTMDREMPLVLGSCWSNCILLLEESNLQRKNY